MKRLFGTDGIRGIANKELTPQLAFQLGRAACIVLGGTEKRPLFIIGKDTRLSCSMLETAIASGIMSMGGNVASLGVIPTPAVAALTRYYKADAGIVISASHNPYYDNGIKFFNSSGLKLADEIEDEIQNVLQANPCFDTFTHEKVGSMRNIRNAGDLYLAFLMESMPRINLKGKKIVLDCANGSTYLTAPELFTKLGADIKVIACKPDGMNINEQCGSTNIARLQNEVIKENADFGLAFDGDGDRLIAVDENGKELNGDRIMYLCAKQLKAQKKLQHSTLVVTVMSNIGLKIALQNEGIDIVETQVGDRYILQKMMENNYNLGGEQSGHIIYSDINTTGDALVSAMLLASIASESGKSLSQHFTDFIEYPQILLNVKVEPDKKLLYQDNPLVEEAVKELNKRYRGEGRILLRHSGTEPLVRIMIEGKNQEAIQKDANALAALIAKISS